ncbi:MAG: DUF4178 domain-containing protein [Verrucomicrobiaceae bacterium]|nr:DUF4178 domain-containing protein [Verrucomicrobiaceae bacterium]
MPEPLPSVDSRRYDCPQCGAPVPFRSSIAIFAVCEHCRSSVVRKDFNVETFGTMAELPPDLSPLQVGTKGHYAGRGFTLIGRLRLHWGDGSWTEWCADFGGGTIGWIAEAMGFYMVSFEQTAPEVAKVDLNVNAGARLTLAGQSWLVNDVKKACCIAVEGELPFAVAPDALRTGIDLTGPDGGFGTVEISGDQRTFYAGHYAQFEELNFTELRKVPGWDQHAEITRHQSQAENCPNCAAPVHIRAEGLSMSAVCGSCATILDTSKPGLAAVGQVMKTTLQIKPVLPIGARGVLKGEMWEVIGFMRRKDQWCSWDEFLLFNPWLGFRFLVTFRGHWSFVRLLPGHHTHDRWNEERFALFAREEVTTMNVLGEFYWRVRSGEKVQLTDYISPPRVLSAEFSKELNEVTWSGGEYIDHLEVQRAFLTDGTRLPSPQGRYLNEPNPHRERWRGMRVTFFLVLGAYILIQLLCLGFATQTKVYDLSGVVSTGNPLEKTIVTKPFTVSGGSAPLHVHTETSALPLGGYLALKGSLVNAKDQHATPVLLPMTNYQSVAEEQRSDVTLPAVPAGEYYFRLEPDASSTIAQAPVRLSVERGGLFWSNFWMGLIAICLWPLWVLMRSSNFEKQRWMESDFSPYASSNDDDDD